MTLLNQRLQYLKNVLGIKSVMIPEGYTPPKVDLPQNPNEFSFQTFNKGSVLFLGSYTAELDKKFSVDELQLLEKIIVALKLNFQKTDIAKVNASSKVELANDLKAKNYSYVFLLGNDISQLFGRKGQFEESGVKFFSTFHPQEMIKNPELKKEAWGGFKTIMENLPK